MELSPIPPLWLVLAARASEVTLTQAQFEALQPESPPKADPSPGALSVERRLQLEPVGDQRVDLRARWRVTVTRPTAVRYALAGPGVEVHRIEIDGRSVSVSRDSDGSTVLSALLTRSSEIAIAGSVRGDPGSGVEILLMEAGSGTVELPPSFAVEGAVRVGPGRAIGAPARLSLAPAPARSEQGALVLGESALGLTIGEGELSVRGRVRFRIARGAVDRVRFSIAGAGPDLSVTGGQIASLRRTGDQVEVVLREPERSLVALEIGFSSPIPPGETATLPIPDLRLDGVFRTTSAVQIARDGQIDVIPALSGWQPTSPASLPEWGQSLVQGIPTSAWLGQGGAGQLSVYRFTPADGPATLIDVAEHTLATTEEGRVLMRARYAVRNDRGAALRITPPRGMTPIGVQVGGRPVTVARDGDVWLVPLEKSIETVEGLLSFPVEVNFLGEALPFGRWERRVVPLPTVDAEIAVSRVSLHLPPGFRSRLRAGSGEVVEAFTEGEGITYGFAVGDVRAAQADALFQRAVDAWMENEFEQTGELLDQLEQMGADNEDIARLRGNVFLLESKADSKAPAEGGGVAMERRVLEQARARSDADAREQEEELGKADQAYASGDYEAAEQAYKKALELGEELEKIQADEDRSQEEVNAKARNKLAAVQQISQQKNDNMASQIAVTGKDRGEAFGDLVTRSETTTAAAPEPPPPVAAPAPPPAPEAEPVVVVDELLSVEVPRRGPFTIRSGSGTLTVGAASAHGAGEEEVQGEFAPNAPADDGVPLTVPGFGAMGGVQGGVVGNVGAGSVGQVIEADASNEIPRHAPEPAAPPPSEVVPVTAATLSVVVPTIGEAVRYQRLLLPADTLWEVEVAARRRIRRNR